MREMKTKRRSQRSPADTTEELQEPSFDNQICYTGGIYDESTELYCLNARYYDPSEGRFISEDTYRGETDTPDTWHLYAYCANDPMNYVDPSGHFIWVLPVLATGAMIEVALDVATSSKQN